MRRTTIEGIGAIRCSIDTLCDNCVTDMPKEHGLEHDASVHSPKHNEKENKRMQTGRQIHNRYVVHE